MSWSVVTTPLQGDGMLWTECLGYLWVFRPVLPGHLAGITRDEIHIPVRRSFEVTFDVVCYCVRSCDVM